MKLIAAACLALLIIGLAGCGSTKPKPPAAHAASASPSYNPYNPQQAASAAASSPPPTAGQAASPMDDWCSGTGYSDYQAVQQDLSQLGTDSGNNDLAAVENDGSQLFNDARAAGQNLPPVSNRQKLDYGLYMGYALIAGYRASKGDVNGAGDSLQKGYQYKNPVAAVAAGCGG